MLTILIGDLIVCDSSQQSWKTEYAFATTFGACLWTMDVTCGAKDDATGAITCQSVGDGCMDSTATNYDVAAVFDDGTCPV